MPNFTLTDLLYIVPSFIVAIVILVGFHELGHFWMARRLGIRVLKFSIGFGKPLWNRVSKKDGVEYVIGSIPLGGYVKLLGERNEENDQPIAAEDLPFSFHRAPVWKRVLVLLAGPFINLVLAAFIYWILLLIGMPALKPVVGEVTDGTVSAQAGLRQGDLITAVQGHNVLTRQDAFVYLLDQLVEGNVQLTVQGDEGNDVPRTVAINAAAYSEFKQPGQILSNLGFDFWHPNDPATIDAVAVGGPAERAGLKAGDLIVSVDGQSISGFTSLIKLVSARAGQKSVFQIVRSGTTLELPVTVSEAVDGGQKVGRIGISHQASQIPENMKVMQKYGVFGAVKPAIIKTWDACMLDFKVIGQMLSGKLSVKNLSGTVGIAEATGQAARQGLLTFIGLLAFISVNLGILNLLPIPVLDGGQVVYQLIELVKGSPVSERAQLIAQQIGIAALIMLVSLTLYNDIARHLS